MAAFWFATEQHMRLGTYVKDSIHYSPQQKARAQQMRPCELCQKGISESSAMSVGNVFAAGVVGVLAGCTMGR